jgi:predicted nucleic acid-binding protein
MEKPLVCTPRPRPRSCCSVDETESPTSGDNRLRSRRATDTLKAAENHGVAVAAGEALLLQRVARAEHLTVDDIASAWEGFRQYHDKDWSFTDCTSKVVIERLGIAVAFAFDSHFEQFGTVVRVP